MTCKQLKGKLSQTGARAKLEAYLEPRQSFKVKLLAKKNNSFQPLTIFAKKTYISDVRQGSE